jgi:hypothetical protein
VVVNMGCDIRVAHARIQHPLKAFSGAMVVADGPPPLGGTGATNDILDLLVTNPRQVADSRGCPATVLRQRRFRL